MSETIEKKDRMVDKEIQKKNRLWKIIFIIMLIILVVVVSLYFIMTSKEQGYNKLEADITQVTNKNKQLNKQLNELTEKISTAKEVLTNKEDLEGKEKNLNTWIKSNQVRKADVDRMVTELEALKNEHDEKINQVVDLNNLEAYNPRASEINRKAFDQLNQY